MFMNVDFCRIGLNLVCRSLVVLAGLFVVLRKVDDSMTVAVAVAVAIVVWRK